MKAKRLLEFVHSDLIGPITLESRDGKQYVLTFIDDFTHFTVAHLLQNKSEVFKYFQIYEAMVIWIHELAGFVVTTVGSTGRRKSH